MDVYAPETSTDAGFVSDAAFFSEASYPEAPGIYLTVTDTAMKGTHSMTRQVACVLDNGYPAISAHSEQIGTVDETINMSLFKVPETGGSYATPGVTLFLAFKDGYEEMGSYPSLSGVGTCTLEADQGWPTLRARFSCTGLVGVQSGTSFEIHDGRIVCP